jgi:hypothetical protein
MVQLRQEVLTELLTSPGRYYDRVGENEVVAKAEVLVAPKPRGGEAVDLYILAIKYGFLAHLYLSEALQWVTEGDELVSRTGPDLWVMYWEGRHYDRIIAEPLLRSALRSTSVEEIKPPGRKPYQSHQDLGSGMRNAFLCLDEDEGAEYELSPEEIERLEMGEGECFALLPSYPLLRTQDLNTFNEYLMKGSGRVPKWFTRWEKWCAKNNSHMATTRALHSFSKNGTGSVNKYGHYW